MSKFSSGLDYFNMLSTFANRFNTRNWMFLNDICAWLYRANARVSTDDVLAHLRYMHSPVNLNQLIQICRWWAHVI